MCHLDVLMPSASALKCKECDDGDRNETGRVRQAHTHTHIYTLECTSAGKMQSFPAPLHTFEHVLYPHSRVSLMELIWEMWVALPRRGIYWQGESQTQSITLPVCPIISHQERWPAKINWLFLKNNPSGKRCAACSQKPPSCTLERENGREVEQLTEAERQHVCTCEGVWRTIEYVSWQQLLRFPCFHTILGSEVCLLISFICPVSQ